MKIELKVNQIKAALECAGKKDARYYLNGILIERTHAGQIYIVSTDGHRMFVGLHSTIEPGTPESVLISRDTLEISVKMKIDCLTLDTETKKLGELTYQTIDGNFPNWRRVVPERKHTPEDNKATQFNPEYILSAAKALKYWSGHKNLTAHILHRGEKQSGIITCDIDTAFIVLMPLRYNNMARLQDFEISDFEAPKLQAVA